MISVKKILQTIYNVSKKEDVDAYAVGGYVRDLLLGIKKKKDIDFVVVGSGLEFAKVFDSVYDGEGSLVEFPDFDTARYVMEDIEIEFAGARAEEYEKGSRKPEVKPATLEEDLSRRDFTVNAIAQEVQEGGQLGDMVDPYDGKKDIEQRILKTPLDPDQTFNEDPLRMLRAARFAAQLNFTLEEKTKESLLKNRKRLGIVSKERVQEEFFKLLASKKPSIGFMILFEEKRLIYNTIKTFKTFDINKLSGEIKEGIEKDIEKIKEYADDNFVRQLMRDFNPNTFLDAVNSALKNSPPPMITTEHVFNGSLAFGPKRKLFPTNKTIIEVEPSRFMNFWYPEVVADIIQKLLRRINTN